MSIVFALKRQNTNVIILFKGVANILTEEAGITDVAVIQV